MPYDHDDGYNWRRFEPPTKPSPSGIFPLNRFGEALLAKITPRQGEGVLSWLTRVEAEVPQICYGEPVPRDFRDGLNRALKGCIPPVLLELWRYAPGISIGSDSFLFDPGTFFNLNRSLAQSVPEILTSSVFFGGADGFNGATGMGTDDPTAYEWSHEEGFTGLTAPSVLHYISERLAWYVTTMQPFCYQHGYVTR